MKNFDAEQFLYDKFGLRETEPLGPESAAALLRLLDFVIKDLAYNHDSALSCEVIDSWIEDIKVTRNHINHYYFEEKKTKVTPEQRVLRLECLLMAIYEALPAFIRSALPDLVHNTMRTLRTEITKGDTHEKTL